MIELFLCSFYNGLLTHVDTLKPPIRHENTTVNTAARMETTGLRDRIHMSFETAELLKAAGRENWVKQREDKVVAKGKGEI